MKAKVRLAKKRNCLLNAAGRNGKRNILVERAEEGRSRARGAEERAAGRQGTIRTPAQILDAL